MSQAFADLFIQTSEHLYEDVLRGLLYSKQKFIPNYYFFDSQGTTYYNEMIDSAEYYVTPCEISILHKQSEEIKQALGKNVTLFELGCSESIKTRILLDGLDEDTNYIAIDNDKESLDNHVEQLNFIYEQMNIGSLHQNIYEQINLPNFLEKKENKVIFFTGSHIGSLSPEEALKFLKSLRKQFKSGSQLLIGHDLLKSSNILEAAYDDKKNCAARFNTNLLRRINRELDSNFDLAKFKHRAIFNRQQNRVEMHLVSLAHQSVNIRGHEVYFTKGESIHTKSAYKYTHLQFTQLLAEAGWKSNQHWVDSKNWYNLQLASC
ncbi:MAG: L-histidine N(alpha)-methyltransferase [Saccharospirillaceae bacterium]|nr:L-histidine N(alpha)-methyltransferase [Pseudomonadales bacterium]NRB81463.1 L-histidine N(alpha)-methyltransferase [Saccharospirillaceae bacterium]